jgi:cytochrome c oxidase subunit 4
MASANAATAHGDEHPEGASIATYFVIFIALLVLLFISVGVAYVHSQSASVRTVLTVVGFSIAGIKAILIMLYFMHVKFSSRLTWIFASGSFFFLLIMVWLTLNDYNTREQVYSTEYHKMTVTEPTGRAEEEGPAAGPQHHTFDQPNPGQTSP